MKNSVVLRLTMVALAAALLPRAACGQGGGKTIRDPIGMEFVQVPAATVMMGSSDADLTAAYQTYKRYFGNATLEAFARGRTRQPRHRVDIRRAFYLGRYEVTIGEWKAVMGDLPEGMKTDLPDRFKMSDRQPVVRVSWNDAQAFIGKLNAMNDGYVYRLPSEAEWEYAARAGTTTEHTGDLASIAWHANASGKVPLDVLALMTTDVFNYSDDGYVYRLPSKGEWEYARVGSEGDPDDLDAIAWYANTSGKARLDALAILSTDAENYEKRLDENENRTHEVGGKKPNGLGLYDMYGNVWEWCEDWFHDSYDGAPTDGSAWVSGGEQKARVLRGGSWYAKAHRVGPSTGDARLPDDRGAVPHLGFRVVAAARN
jgi:formylglycine-generating enzyme required for sulfatase activity